MGVILAIESSCDDTSASVNIDGEVKSNITSTQIEHADFGGVVPEVASRQHQISIVKVVDEALNEAKIKKSQIDAVAFTSGPGLLGSLIVGTSFAKSFALSLDVPLIEVHHMQAHILSHFAEEPKPRFPFICLTVSGGHTQLVIVRSYKDMDVVGTTIDDAAGEAFDKVGKMLGLPYPAGPLIDNIAKSGNAIFKFAKPKVKGYDYSFSGFKTSVLYFLQKKMKEDPTFIKTNLSDLCCSVQCTIIDILLEKLTLLSKETGINDIAIAGGVSANSHLREELKKVSSLKKWNLYIPSLQYCTDNAGMVGVNAHFKYLDKDYVDQSITPKPRMPYGNKK